MLAGAALQGLYGLLDLEPGAFAGVAEHEHLGPVAQLSGALLAGLLVAHLAVRLRSLRKAPVLA